MKRGAGGLATYSQAGAQFGAGLLWTMAFTTTLMISIQMLSARIGWVPGEGNRAGRIGALLVGYHDAPGDRPLRFAGRVGTGFREAELQRLAGLFEGLATDTCPFDPLPPPAELRRRPRWLRPELVAELAFAEWTGDGRLTVSGKAASLERRRTVARVWIAAAYRRRGLAAGLLKATARYFRVECAELGWELPLTESGALLLRSLLPENWFGRGDLSSLRQTLDTFGRGSPEPTD